MRTRRIIASIIDFLILMLFFAAMISFIPLNDKIKDGYAKMDKIEAEAGSYSKLTNEQLDEINKISYEIDHEFVKYYLITSVILIGYFIFVPKLKKDQTFGQKIMKVRLVNDNEITWNIYIIRALLNSGLSLTIFCPLLLYILNRVWYSRVTSILLMTQLMYWVASTIIFLITKEAIHDKITKTKIIEVKR